MHPLADARPRALAPVSYVSSVEAALDRALEEERVAAASTAPFAVHLVSEVARTVRAGGKRIRPAMCYWGYRAGGGRDESALAVAGAALELFHTAAIIHDDIVDASLLRRGRATTHRHATLAAAHADRNADEDAGRAVGVSAALLAGDLAQVLADRLLADAPFPADRVVAAFRHFNRARSDAVRGEYLDLAVTWSTGAAVPGAPTEPSETELRRLAALKAGSYTVVGPLLVGAALAAGQDEALEAVLRAYGEPLGEAFQLRDDVLGTFGTASATGKDPDEDLREGKRTLLVAIALRRARADERAALVSALGDPGLTPDRADRARDVIRGSGALEEALDTIAGLVQRARLALAGGSFDGEVRGALDAMAAAIAAKEL